MNKNGKNIRSEIDKKLLKKIIKIQSIPEEVAIEFLLTKGKFKKIKIRNGFC